MRLTYRCLLSTSKRGNRVRCCARPTSVVLRCRCRSSMSFAMSSKPLRCVPYGAFRGNVTPLKAHRVQRQRYKQDNSRSAVFCNSVSYILSNSLHTCLFDYDCNHRLTPQIVHAAKRKDPVKEQVDDSPKGACPLRISFVCTPFHIHARATDVCCMHCLCRSCWRIQQFYQDNFSSQFAIWKERSQDTCAPWQNPEWWHQDWHFEHWH